MSATIYDYNQFITYKLVEGAPKLKKVPFNTFTGKENEGYHSGEGWLSYNDAVALAQHYGLGVGFVFTANDPFFFVDIDNCLTENGWSDFALSVCAMFPGCMIERSVSGTGLHIFGHGTAPEGHRNRDDPRGLEVYTQKRFVALGVDAQGDSSVECSQGLNALLATMPEPSGYNGQLVWTDKPVADWRGPEDDDELIKMMLASKPSIAQNWGNKATIKQLWEADKEALTLAFPSPTGARFDHSSADAALVTHLAWWTGKDCARMDRLFRRSALYREDKWGKRKDYRCETIGSSIAMTQGVLQVKSRESEDAQGRMVPTLGVMWADQQPEYFKGCVYVRDEHRMFVPDTGELLKPDTFKAVYGGYQFVMDATNEQKTKSAFECFTESRLHHFPKVHSTCFRPELEPGSIVDDCGLLYVNTYVPVQVPVSHGDVSPFLDLMCKLFPDPRDRDIMLSYAAAVVQYPGVKFQWSPLVQGMEGNGKTFLATCIKHAVGRKFFHPPNAKELTEGGGKFNKWLKGKLFIAIEEIYVGDRRETEDALKTMITNEDLEFQAKGGDQVAGDNRANFYCATNHEDAIRANKNKRRWSIFYTPQQTIEDLERDGMVGDYFPNLYEWAKNGGYSDVTGYLKTYKINDQFNPATHCMRGPETSSTAKALEISLGPIEQEILEFVEANTKQGMMGPWVSSTALYWLINDKMRKNISPKKRGEIMENLGYVKHPALKGGRVGSPIVHEGNARPVLYIKDGSPEMSISDPTSVRDAYCTAQNYAVVPQLTPTATGVS